MFESVEEKPNAAPRTQRIDNNNSHKFAAHALLSVFNASFFFHLFSASLTETN